LGAENIHLKKVYSPINIVLLLTFRDIS